MLLARAVIALYLCLNLFCVPKFVTGDEPDLVVEPSESDFKRASRDPVKVDVNVSPALSENEMYRDILHITKDNFTDIVLKSKDPWVIIFHDGNFYKTWKTMAASLRGIIWFGLVHQDEKEILKTLKIEVGNVPQAMVFPYNYYGNAKSRQEKAVRVKTPVDARKRAISTLPDNVIKLDKTSVQDFLIESYVGRPAKFPLVYMTYERETPALIKALNVRFSEYFHFGIMNDPDTEDLKALGLDEKFANFPALMVLVARSKGASKEPELNAIFFDTAKIGEMTYPNVVRFLFQMNERFRATIPGDNMASEKRVATMSDVVAIESLRFNILGAEDLSEDMEEMEEKDEL